MWGPDKYGTSAAVATRFFAKASLFGVATGLNYPDALAGGVFMATGGRLGPVLLVNTTAPLAAPISGYLNTLALGTPGVFGGPIAVADFGAGRAPSRRGVTGLTAAARSLGAHALMSAC